MKATTWLCPVLTLLCATRLACTAQRGVYPLDYADSNLIQDDYLLQKRNKPSLSIVNPLDVLRQRLLLEIARRQMKENTRQVELNRAILKNVGKRFHPAKGRYQMAALQQQQQQQYPTLLEYVPTKYIFDLLQRPAFEAYNENGRRSKSLDIGLTKHHQMDGNEIGNETNHENTNGAAVHKGNNLLRGVDGGGGDAGGSLHKVSDAGLVLNTLAEDVDADDSDVDVDDDDVASRMTADNANQLRYLYRLHRNHFAKK